MISSFTICRFGGMSNVWPVVDISSNGPTYFLKCKIVSPILKRLPFILYLTFCISKMTLLSYHIRENFTINSQKYSQLTPQMLPQQPLHLGSGNWWKGWVGGKLAHGMI